GTPTSVPDIACADDLDLGFSTGSCCSFLVTGGPVPDHLRRFHEFLQDVTGLRFNTSLTDYNGFYKNFLGTLKSVEFPIPSGV
ncbi:hypothetical protein J6590_089481, partial [Homalodisca vitripennis]